MEQFTLPENKFGMTAINYRLPALPSELPEWNVQAAANDLNRCRYEDLTVRQRLFVDSYLGNGFDATQAAIDACYSTCVNEASKIGDKLVKSAHVKQAIAYAIKFFFEKQKFNFKADVHFWRLYYIATADIADYVDELGVFKMPECKNKRMAIASVTREYKSFGTGRDKEIIEYVKFTLYNAMDAIKMLMAIFGPDWSEHFGRSATEGRRSLAGSSSDSNMGGSVMFEIIAVPSGEFIPAPAAPVRTIEHSN